jgi:hypothetical protein
MPRIDTLPVPIQTLYAELVDRAWTGDIGELMAAGGSAYTRTVNGRLYWYWQPPGRVSARYLGQDSEDLRARVQEKQDLAAIKRERSNLVRALRSANMPAPDRRSGAVLAALSSAGAFRLRAVLIGSVAFQTYLPLLGVRLPASLSTTGDVDIGQFHSISLAVEDEIDADLLTVLRTVDRRFEAIPSPLDTRKIQRYAIQVGSQEEFSVDVLCPLRGPIRDQITTLKALRGGAQVIKHLDFLLYSEVNAVVLHGPGIPVNVPAPERYALHKLLVSQMRIDTPRSQTKARKDLQQADALIRVLSADRSHDLEEAWAELRQRGPSWRLKADRAVAVLPADTRAIMEKMTADLDGSPSSGGRKAL